MMPNLLFSVQFVSEVPLIFLIHLKLLNNNTKNRIIFLFINYLRINNRKESV